jgi:tripartite-type tricarboxylate transporter receptor subunit TctC
MSIAGMRRAAMSKGWLFAAIVAHASFGVGAATVPAESYPNKPIRLLDGFPAGGGTDYVARVTGAKITERFGQTVLVDNRPGAGSALAAEITARAIPDGYTLMLIASSALASSPSLYPKLGFALKDFSYISLVATGTYVLVVHPSLPARSVTELVALARAKPNSIRYGSGGVASPIHLTAQLLQNLTSIELLHVPYKGAVPAVVAAAGGEVLVAFSSVAAAMPMIQAKRLNALAVSSAKRTGALPEVPTMVESGVAGFDVTPAYGILGPSGTPASVVKLLNAEVRKIVQMDDVKAKFAAQALEAAASTPGEFRAIIDAEAAQWARVIKDANIPVN